MISEFDNLHSTLKIGKKEKDQLLFASQSYGTNYFVYGHFITKNGDDKKCTITGLEMLVLNYKGLLDIGFSTHEDFKTTISKVEEDGKDPMILVELTMQAVVSGSTVPNVSINLEKPITIEPRTNLKVIRKLLPISGDIDSHPITNGVFDEEFYYRDGWVYARKMVRDIADEGNCFPVREIQDNALINLGPGIKCRVAHFQIDFNN